jgi:apolipoprotein N-acyltransferase
MSRMRRVKSRRGSGRLLLPLLGGVLLALAFPPLRLWPLVFVAWVPLWLSFDPCRDPAGQGPGIWGAFGRGWLMGFVAFLIMLHWILWLSNEEVTIPGLMIPGLFLMAAYLGLFFGAAAGLSAALCRWSGLAIAMLAPLATAFFEWLRAQGVLGFPWGAPGYALARVPALLQSSAFAGFWGLVLLVLIVNGLLTHFLRGRILGLVGAIALVALLWIQGGLVLRHHPAGAISGDRRALRVLVAQPDVRREIKWKPEKLGEVFRIAFEHADSAAARSAAAGGFDLFVWPETALPTLIYHDPETITRTVALVDRMRTPLLMGTEELYDEWGERPWEQGAYNSAVLVSPGGRISDPYRKIKLVPFSERMPLQKIAPWITGLDFGQSNFFPGTGPVLFQVGAERVGCLICCESAFPEIARASVRQGATVLANITNDFWFGATAGPVQHAEMAILRAVENRVPVVRCANTGVSFAVDPWGRVSHETAIFTQADFVATVAAGGGCFASRHPDWILWVLAGSGLLAIGCGFRRRMKG